MKYVWVVRALSLPHIDQYELIEKTSKGNIRVNMRGSPALLRKAEGFYFLFTEKDVKNFVKNWLEKALVTARQKVTELERLLETPYPVYFVPNKAEKIIITDVEL